MLLCDEPDVDKRAGVLDQEPLRFRPSLLTVPVFGSTEGLIWLISPLKKHRLVSSTTGPPSVQFQFEYLFFRR